MPRRINVALATILGFIGPPGYLYLGWRYAVCAGVLGGILGVALGLVGILLEVPWWTKVLTFGVFGWRAGHVATVINTNPDDPTFKTWRAAWMAVIGMCPLLGLCVGISVGIEGALIFVRLRQYLIAVLLLFFVVPGVVKFFMYLGALMGGLANEYWFGGEDLFETRDATTPEGEGKADVSNRQTEGADSGPVKSDATHPEIEGP